MQIFLSIKCLLLFVGENWWNIQRQRGVNVEGGSSSTLPYTYPFSNFPKYPLHCLLAQAIFTVSSVSVIDLWQCISWQLFRWSCFIVLLGSSWVVWGQKMCAHVTGIVRYIGKSVFRYQNVSAPPNFFGGVATSPLPLLVRRLWHLDCFGDNRRTKDSRKIKLCGLKVCCVTLFSYCISHNFPALKCINHMLEWKSLKGCLKNLSPG